ncbi:hypothetical protein PILCRDRAFT_93686 [Piloderma croceum F 1598]|uniref:Putative ER transporter 6TM N-terminal domain-containing protein n=1 Tax=Piloderma croceum (strain F 1598) TaxID=765440 RepID=A0A0C3EVJ3_PILCF|nr:hypothetical protein PILCRDRAFT_93686 [Piloderma croceum F 1598]
MADRPTTAGTNVSENVTRDTSSHSSVAQEEKQPDTNTTSPPKKSLLDSLPPWASTNLRSANSWKLLARCWLASWAAFVLLMPQASLNILGNTAFFTVMTSLFLPANLPVQMFVFSIATVVIGVLLGWGIGAAGMRGALAARNQVLLKSTLEKVQSSAAGLANPELLFSLKIFEGVFLDTRSSIVFGCFLAIGTFFFALVRAYAPKLTLLSIFGTIAVDIFCGIGPLFPFAQYTLLNSMCTCIACYMGIAIVVTFFVFPETMNHSCLSATSAQLGLIKSLVGMQATVLESKPSQLAPGTPLMTKILGLRQGMLGAQKACKVHLQLLGRNHADFRPVMAKSVFINLEFSWGRWNGDDVRSLEAPLLALVTRVASLQTFARIVGERHSQEFDISKTAGTNADVSAAPSTLPSAVPSTETLPSATSNDAYLLHQIYRRHDSLESLHSLHIEDILPVIKNSTADLREACIEGLGAAQASIDIVNTCRWRTDAEAVVNCHQRFDAALARLSAAMTAFKDTNRKLLIEPFMPVLMEADTREARRALPLRSLYLSYVFATNLIVVGDVLVTFMEQVRTTLEKRKHPRLWAPKGLRAIKKFLTERDHEDAAVFGEDSAPEKTETGINEESYRRDPDSRPPSNVPQKIMNSIHHVYQWSKTPEALFTFKYTFVSVALWLPGVFLKTAHIQVRIDDIYKSVPTNLSSRSYVIRIAGTFAGLCLGLATWYIGAGSGIGNPYGMAASVAVFLVPLLWFRLFLPIQYQAGGILIAVTWALIVGYSWIDGHLPIVGTPGIGWTVAWKRWTLVVVGQ